LRRFATKVIFKSLKEGEQMSALRNWIVTNLENLLPSAPMTIWSDTNGSQFQQLTGLTQEELMTKWYGPKDSSGNRSGTGTDPTFTTCTSFLPIFASKVCSAGGLAGKQLRPFKLNTENGWVANADGTAPIELTAAPAPALHPAWSPDGRTLAFQHRGDKGWEITFKGPKAMEDKDMSEYLRRRKFSLENILRHWVNDPTVALFFEGNALAADRPALQVSLINAKNEGVTLFLDADSHLPIKKSFVWRDPVDKQRNIEEETFDNYRPVQGIMTPYGFTRYFNGDMANQRFLNAAAYNQGFDQTMFDPNSGYNPNKPSGKH